AAVAGAGVAAADETAGAAAAATAAAGIAAGTAAGRAAGTGGAAGGAGAGAAPGGTFGSGTNTVAEPSAAPPTRAGAAGSSGRRVGELVRAGAGPRAPALAAAGA